MKKQNLVIIGLFAFSLSFFLSNLYWTFKGEAVGENYGYASVVEPVFAQDEAEEGAGEEETAPQPETSENISCVTTLKPYFKTKREEFQVFMDSHFQNKSSNSSLFEIAMQKFREYENELNTETNRQIFEVPGAVGQQGQPQAQELAEILKCTEMRDEELVLARELLQNHVMSTAQTKKALLFVEKLQSINSGLRKLNRDLGEMKGYFEIFSSKVNFVEKCT